MAERLTRAALLFIAACAASGPGNRGRAADAEVSFARDIKPMLARRCFACHGPDGSEGGLRLDAREDALAELESGARAIVPGDVAASALIARVKAHDELERMPPEGKPLTADEIAALEAWIEQGAEWEKHWAFVPPRAKAPPRVEHRAWASHPIDAFILTRLEERGLTPAPAADKRSLVRRAYFNVTGLPPTIEQIETFVEDDRGDAWPRLVDQLLESPHYGERWARHWLDVVRFAETNSFERDGLKPNAWRYRDYVIRSFNDDKPYDQFLREQLAGDELDEPTDETMIATGFYRLGPWDDEPADPLQARYDDLDDILSTTSQAMLGLTIGCARCHDHKIDPIPQRDYYGMLAFFADVTPYADIYERDPARFSQWDLSSPEHRERRAALRQQRDEIRRELKAMEEVGIRRMTAAEQEIAATPDREALLREKLEQRLNVSEWRLYKDAKKRHRKVEEHIEQLPREAALALAKCEPNPAPTHVLVRGNPHAVGEEVAPDFPELFGEPAPTIPQPGPGARSAGRRRILAEWIASPRNMLTARVIVNRVWQHHFGRGIVRSANNFGELGDLPTHPELLDWLALWLIDQDWQLKPLHRLIMTSRTYCMSTQGDSVTVARASTIDPTNDLFWRYDSRRLSGEEIRDAMLLATGELNHTMFGPGVYPKLSPAVLATQSRPGDGWGESSTEEQARRSVYIHVKRSLLTPLLTAFDFPDVDASCEARFVTTQPGQALAMLHGEFANERAAKLAERVAVEAEGPHERVAKAVEAAIGRPPMDEEIADGEELIEKLVSRHGCTPDEALRYWCLTLLNLNEFIYLD